MALNSKSQFTIVHLIASNFYGGPEKQIVEHLKRLDKTYFRGIVVSFFEGEVNQILQKAAEAGLQNYSIPMNGPLDIRALWDLNQFVKKNQVNLLCVHGYKAAVMGWLAGKKNKIPVLAFSRGYTAENKKVAFYEWLDRQVLKRVSGIIAVSEGQKKKLDSYGVYGKKSWVVHNAVVTPQRNNLTNNEIKNKVFAKLAIPDNSKLVVSAGRLSPEKGHKYLVDAIGQISKKRKNTIFVFCGDGVCKKDLENQAKNLGVYTLCRFPGFQRNVHDFFQLMDLMVLPSLTEGLPNVVLEAFSWAKPVVATKVGGVPELVVDGQNGYLVADQRPDLLAKAIDVCLTSPENMRAMGQKGYERVVLEFSFENQTQKLEKIYHEILIRSL